MNILLKETEEKKKTVEVFAPKRWTGWLRKGGHAVFLNTLLYLLNFVPWVCFTYAKNKKKYKHTILKQNRV